MNILTTDIYVYVYIFVDLNFIELKEILIYPKRT